MTYLTAPHASWQEASTREPSNGRAEAEGVSCGDECSAVPEVPEEAADGGIPGPLLWARGTVQTGRDQVAAAAGIRVPGMRLHSQPLVQGRGVSFAWELAAVRRQSGGFLYFHDICFQTKSRCRGLIETPPTQSAKSLEERQQPAENLRTKHGTCEVPSFNQSWRFASPTRRPTKAQSIAVSGH